MEYAGELVGRKVRIAQEPRRMRPSKSEVRRLCADNSRLRELTGWVPQTELSEGLAQTFAWLKDHASSLGKTPTSAAAPLYRGVERRHLNERSENNKANSYQQKSRLE